jgi:hypothetical protein
MHTTQVSTPSLVELATQAVRLGREVGRMAHAVELDGGTRAPGSVSATLRRLAARDAFDPQDGMAMDAISTILTSELAAETVGTERQFFPTHYDEHGSDGEVRDCPVYSPRGQELLRLQRALEAFAAAREAVLDRVAAERALRDLLAP